MCKRVLARHLTQFILLLLTLALIALISGSATSKNSLLIYVNKTEIHTIRPVPKVSCPNNLPELWAEMNSLKDPHGIYPKNLNIQLIKTAIRCAKIIHVESLRVQNSFKWILTLEGGQKILFKPLLLRKDQRETTCNTGCEHPEYEVTAYVINSWIYPQINRAGKVQRASCAASYSRPDCQTPTWYSDYRLLGFNNMPLTTGRNISWLEEIYPVATHAIKSLLKTKNNSDVCFKWQCPYIEGISEFCFIKGLIQGSATVWLNKTINIFYPENKTGFQYHDFHYYSRQTIPTRFRMRYATADHFLYPFRDSVTNAATFTTTAARQRFKKYLQGDDRYCSVFRSQPPYNEDRMFYHIIDMAVIDYMLNNVDQRHTYIIGDDGKTIVNVMIDFGQSLCPTSVMTLGAPIYQCCSIRNATFQAVYRLRDTLEQEFEKETRDDPMFPLLLPSVFNQMQRQLKEITAFLDFCVFHKGLKNVIID